MDGQACVFYGAAEFSRDIDLAILVEPKNIECLKALLSELQASVIAIPDFDLDYLHRGHAIHFRAQHPEAQDLRIDIMAKMRGVDTFDNLWQRRTTIQVSESLEYNLLALPDLVQAKKTQRDKDWPMIRRLLEANYFENRDNPNEQTLNFWFKEMRSPQLLIDLAQKYSLIVNGLISQRPLLSAATKGAEAELEELLKAEEDLERKADRQYWDPLKKELEQLRLQKTER